MKVTIEMSEQETRELSRHICFVADLKMLGIWSPPTIADVLAARTYDVLCLAHNEMKEMFIDEACKIEEFPK